MIEKLTKKVQQDRGITFKPTIRQYRPPQHAQSLKKVIEGNKKEGDEKGSHSERLSEQDLLSRPYYPATKKLELYTK